jgi:transposase-like protein
MVKVNINDPNYRAGFLHGMKHAIEVVHVLDGQDGGIYHALITRYDQIIKTSSCPSSWESVPREHCELQSNKERYFCDKCGFQLEYPDLHG